MLDLDGKFEGPDKNIFWTKNEKKRIVFKFALHSFVWAFDQKNVCIISKGSALPQKDENVLMSFGTLYFPNDSYDKRFLGLVVKITLVM